MYGRSMLRPYPNPAALYPPNPCCTPTRQFCRRTGIPTIFRVIWFGATRDCGRMRQRNWGQDAAEMNVGAQHAAPLLQTMLAPTPNHAAPYSKPCWPLPKSCCARTQIMLRPYTTFLRAPFRGPLLRPTLLAQLRHRGAHVVRDLALLSERRDHRLRLLGIKLER